MVISASISGLFVLIISMPMRFRKHPFGSSGTDVQSTKQHLHCFCVVIIYLLTNLRSKKIEFVKLVHSHYSGEDVKTSDYITTKHLTSCQVGLIFFSDGSY